MKASILLFIAVTIAFLNGCVTNRNRTPEEIESLSQKLRNLKTEGPRKRILVLPILNESPDKDPAIAKAARDSFVKGLKETDNFIIVDNSDLSRDVNNLKKEGGYNMPEISKMAQELGVVAILEGKIVEINARKLGEEVGLLRQVRADVRVTVNMKVYSPTNSKEVFNEVREAQSSEKNYRVLDPDGKKTLASDPLLTREALFTAFAGFIPTLSKSIDKLGWSGRVAYVRGEKVYLNAGRMTGLNVGDILKVMETGEDIFDPETGLFIGKAPGRVKGTLEIVNYFGKDGCVAIIHSGSGFKENDKVELY